MRYVLNGEAGLEQEQRHALHELDRVHLVTEERLLAPHTTHHQLFVFEEDREGTNEEVYATLERPLVVLICDDLELNGDIVHGFDDLPIISIIEITYIGQEVDEVVSLF